MKKRIGLFFGGMGNEAEISIMSARNIAANFDSRRYELVLIHWNKDGRFFKVNQINDTDKKDKRQKVAIEELSNIIDIAFPVTHGRGGEDGVLQGILESQRIKYCGSRLLSSALCMDKAVFKQYMSSHGIKQTRFRVLDFNFVNARGVNRKLSQVKTFKLPFYVKPANSGSSIGITKVNKFSELKPAVKEAMKHDSKIVIEEGVVNPREIEVAVIGNSELTISIPGELVLQKDFYDYHEKYELDHSRIVIPAEMQESNKEKIMGLAEKVYRLCGCIGFARIDFFLKGKDIYLNEVNTIPGFTDISMFSILMKNMGFPYRQLINEIIRLAY